MDSIKGYQGQKVPGYPFFMKKCIKNYCFFVKIFVHLYYVIIVISVCYFRNGRF